MPSLRQLEYLVAVAETRHFRRAAEKTNTTQPTLSEQLKALEDRLSAQLVERTRSRVILTPLGNQVVEIAKRILRDAQEIRELAKVGGRELGGVISLGLPSSIGPYLLPRVVPELHLRYPELRLYLREALPQLLPVALQEGSHDIIITPLPVRGADLHSIPIFREPLYLAVAADHKLARKERVRRTDLAGEQVLALGPGHQLHEVVLALCEEFGAKVRLDYEGTSLDTLREMVVTGLGITFLPGLYVRSVLTRDKSIRTLELHGRAVYRTIGMAWRKSSARHASYEQLAGLFRDIVQNEYDDFRPLT